MGQFNLFLLKRVCMCEGKKRKTDEKIKTEYFFQSEDGVKDDTRAHIAHIGSFRHREHGERRVPWRP